MSKYDELKRLAEAATPGPWSYDGSYICPARVEGETTYVESWSALADSHQMENVRYIAAANPAAILELIAEVDRLAAEYQIEIERHRTTREQLEQAKRECEELRAYAERYRWVRNPDQDVSLVLDKRVSPGVYEYRAGEELDEAIDAAMQEPK